MKYLLDSDYVADFLRGREPAKSIIPTLLDEPLAISIITFAEIYEGIHYGQNPDFYKQAFRQFLRGTRVLTLNRAIATEYAIIRGDLRAKGMLITATDLFIGATAKYYDLTLVTRNLRHYERIPGLRIFQSR